MQQPLCFAHSCTDTLCRLRCEIVNHGPDETWRHLPEFVMEIRNFVQDPRYLRKYNHFMIHEIFRPCGVTNPFDFIVIVGQAALRLGPFAFSTIGSAALRDLFQSPYFPQLSKQAIEQSLQLWSNRPDRMTCDQDSRSLYEVSLSPMGRRIRWNKKIQCEYTFESLSQTEAGRAILAIPIRSGTDTGGEVTGSVFEFESLDGDPSERPKGHLWVRLRFMLCCGHSEN